MKIIPHRDDIHRHTWEGAQGGRQAFPFATSSRKVYDILESIQMNGKHIASALLLLCLALSAVRASADGAVTFGASVVANDPISGLDTLACVGVAEPFGTDASGSGSVWNCAVNCSAQVADAGDPGNATLSITDEGAIVAGSERTFEMTGLSPRAISTTIMTTFSDTTDPDQLCCAAQEVGATDIEVSDSSISVVCTDLPNPFIIPL